MVIDVYVPEFAREAVLLGFPLDSLVNEAFGPRVDVSAGKVSRFIATSAIRGWASVNMERIRKLRYSCEGYEKFKKFKSIVNAADLVLEDLCPEPL